MIYLLKSHNKLKIGYTKNLDNRLRQYKTHNLDIELLNSKEGSLVDENALHSICSGYRIENEWFECDQFVIESFTKYIPLKPINRADVDVDIDTQAYFNKLKSLFRVKYISDMKLIIELSIMSRHNTREVDISTKRRDLLCAKLDIKKTHLSTSLKRLKELNLIRGEKGSYTIEEAVFWKGDKKTRRELMKEKGL